MVGIRGVLGGVLGSVCAHDGTELLWGRPIPTWQACALGKQAISRGMKCGDLLTLIKTGIKKKVNEL